MQARSSMGLASCSAPRRKLARNRRHSALKLSPSTASASPAFFAAPAQSSSFSSVMERFGCSDTSSVLASVLSTGTAPSALTPEM